MLQITRLLEANHKDSKNCGKRRVKQEEHGDRLVMKILYKGITKC